MKTKQVLPVVQQADADASVFDLTMPDRPTFRGDEGVNLVCGGCGMILANGVSIPTMHKRFMVNNELLLCCGKCRALVRLI
jgi:hypothetical protein